MKINNSTLLVVIYDGVENSVFESQVITPLLRRLNQDSAVNRVIIASFESKKNSKISEIITKNTDLFTLHILPKQPFLGLWQLKLMAKKVKKFITDNADIVGILARGQLAGLIGFYATKEHFHIPVTIQIRGLLTEEYLYAHEQESGIRRFIHQLRANLYYAIEKIVYSLPIKRANILLEAVSQPLKDYLIANHQASPDVITLPAFDYLEPMAPDKKIYWRSTIRKKLTIPEDAIVWCYSGSAKPWQCIEETIIYFNNVLRTLKNSYLMILTPDINAVQKLISTSEIPTKQVKICTVRPSEILHYLAAADKGIMFRQPHVINWVSRPTKLLEYQAAGLEIIHNNTIGLLATAKDSPSLQRVDLPMTHQARPVNQVG